MTGGAASEPRCELLGSPLPSGGPDAAEYRMVLYSDFAVAIDDEERRLRQASNLGRISGMVRKTAFLLAAICCLVALQTVADLGARRTDGCSDIRTEFKLGF